tara:strand:+ start:5145 stop:5306 length:162 start_codon:yes stop_codon:yes gene_type:complete
LIESNKKDELESLVGENTANKFINDYNKNKEEKWQNVQRVDTNTIKTTTLVKK